MVASTRSKFERWSGGMPLAVPLAFGAVLVIATFASKLGDSSLYFYVPLVFAATGTMIWLKARHTPTLVQAAVGSALLIGSGLVVAVCGLAGGLLLDSQTFWASIGMAAAIAAPIGAAIAAAIPIDAQKVCESSSRPPARPQTATTRPDPISNADPTAACTRVGVWRAFSQIIVPVAANTRGT
uniref:hypothetical protein n=1 Tax=Rhodococcus sp. 06-412-2B TaxID=2022512 RepID=UPI00113FEF38|nr:hypothetical protein [Rhodococcus sp. 06-412-2B]